MRRDDRPPPKLTPPFGEGVLLDWYESGGIDGRAVRVRVTADEAVLYFFGEEQARSALTAEETTTLAALRAEYKAIHTQSSDGGVPDGMSRGLFLAGSGAKANDWSGPSDFAGRLEQRLQALVKR